MRCSISGGKNKPVPIIVSTVVEVALKENNIKSLRINQRSGGGAAIQKFRKDPDILVLLLDGYVHSLSLFLSDVHAPIIASERIQD